MNEHDWDRLATLFGPTFDGDEDTPARWAPYAGYKPEVREAPNGDTRECGQCYGLREQHGPGGSMIPCRTCHGSGRVPNVDAEGACTECGGFGKRFSVRCGVCDGSGRAPAKRYLHVAEKYLAQHPGLEWPRGYIARAHWEACRVATALGVPAAYRPHEADGTLRVIEYPCGAGTVEHTDPDLFTIVLWRSHPGDLELTTDSPITPHGARALADSRRIRRELSPGLHIGELGELVGLGPATPHRVPARPYRQRSIVYFAVPDHAALLPWRESECPSVRDVPTVGEYLADWKKRSRVAAGGYK